MFSYLRELDRGLYDRYLTLEKNIRAASNSFYDSYIDLAEHFLRFVMRSEGVDVSFGGSTGSLLRHPECFRILVTETGVAEADYEKLGDYIRKINGHKHKHEKKISLDLAVRYLSVIHTVMGAYASRSRLTVKAFDSSRISEIFDSYERENATLRAECERLVERLECVGEDGVGRSEVNELKEVLSSDWFCAMPPERQNEELRRHLSRLGSIMSSINEIKEGQRREEEVRLRDKAEILGAISELRGRLDAREAKESTYSREEQKQRFKKFVAGSRQEHIWLGDEKDFLRSKLISALLLLASLTLSVITTLLTTECSGFYTTYTFLENIWFLLSLYLMRNTLFSKRHYAIRSLKKRCHIIYTTDSYGIYAQDGQKKRYIVFLVLACLSTLLNLICIWNGESAYRVTATVLELISMPLFIVSYIFTSMHFTMYSSLKLTGPNLETGKEVSIVVDPISNQMYSLDDYYKKYPQMK